MDLARPSIGGPDGAAFETVRTIPALDGIRGFAALVVVGGHLTTDLIAVPGVYLFFILSSFLLSSQLLRWKPVEFLHPRRLVYYLQRRFFRIFPLFTAVVILSALTTYFFATYFQNQGIPITIRPDQLLATLTLHAGPELLWTIPVEFKFYFFLLCIMALVRLGWEFSKTVATLIVSSLAIVAFATIEPQKHSLSVLPFLPLFLCGVALAAVDCAIRQLLASRSSESRRWALLGLELLGWVGLLGFFLTMPVVQNLIFDIPVDRREMALRHDVYAALFVMLILGAVYGSGLLRYFFHCRPARLVGQVSFSLYLLHLAPIRVLDALLPSQPHLAGSIAVGLSLLLSLLSYHYIERPILKATSTICKMSG